MGYGWQLSQLLIYLIMVGVCVFGCGGAEGGEGKGLDSRGAGFDARKGHQSGAGHHAGAFFKSLVMWETVEKGLGNGWQCGIPEH